MANTFEQILDDLINVATGGLRKRVALLMSVFFLGAIFGVLTPLLQEKTGVAFVYWLIVPLALAVLAYASTEVAAALFILMLGLILLIFL